MYRSRIIFWERRGYICTSRSWILNQAHDRNHDVNYTTLNGIIRCMSIRKGYRIIQLLTDKNIHNYENKRKSETKSYLKGWEYTYYSKSKLWNYISIILHVEKVFLIFKDFHFWFLNIFVYFLVLIFANFNLNLFLNFRKTQ